MADAKKGTAPYLLDRERFPGILIHAGICLFLIHEFLFRFKIPSEDIAFLE
jgi:hypothetical protein